MNVYDNLLKYFNRTVRPYLPYRNNKVYQSLCSVLRDYFFKDSYLTIPQDLSTYVENQKINTTLYSNLLIGNGYPNNLVMGWSSSQKEIILEKLMHYQNEAGTLRHYIDICDAFNENFDVYELYADSRIILDTVQNKVVKKWIMAANPIYLSSKLPKIYYSEDTERIHDYDEIYNGTPTYFISTKQLNYWYYFAKAIVLPFKTNLIMLIWKSETEFSMLDSIMMATTYSYYQNEYVNLTCNNVAYHLRISDIYQIWHYLLLYASEDDEKTFNQTIRNVIFGISNSPIFTLKPGLDNSIDKVIEAYNNIIDKDSSDYFINNFYSKFSSYINNGANTIEIIRKKLLFKVPADLIAYLEYLIDSGISRIFGLYNALSIIEQSVDSFIENSEDELLQKYGKWLKILLSKPTVNVKQTITYQLLYQFKPYHTRFIEKIKIKIISDDKTNNCFIKDIVYFVIHLWQDSGVVISDHVNYIKNIYSNFYLVNGENTVSGNCLDFKVKIGDIITFSSTSLGIADFDCHNVQIIDITHTNPIITNDQFVQIKNNIEFNNTFIEEYFNALIILIVNLEFDTVIENLTYELNRTNNKCIFIKEIIKELIIIENEIQIIEKEEFNQTIIEYFDVHEYIINYLNQQLLPTLEIINIDNIEYYKYNDLINIIDRLNSTFEFNSNNKYIIKKILYSNVICTLHFDLNWKCPTGYYDKLINISLPPINETVSGGLWSFSNLDVINYVHCNEIAFNSIYLNDIIFVPEDGVSYGIKVIGKDLNTLNLLTNTNYKGTAGTFNVIGRYRSGF